MKKVYRLSEAFNLQSGDIVTLTGAGGKTSSLYRLGEENRDQKVLLTTTTKMKYPTASQVEHCYSVDEIGEQSGKAEPGRTFLHGRLTPEGKCTSVLAEQLSSVVTEFALTVIEADGSKTLPLKGYFETEPCIPDFATVNVGILTVKGLGLEADPSFILRFEEFLKMANLNAHERITETHLARWIAHPQGMFKGSYGRKVLFWNQIESQEEWEQMERVMRSMNESFRADLDRVVAGSLKYEEYYVL